MNNIFNLSFLILLKLSLLLLLLILFVINVETRNNEDYDKNELKTKFLRLSTIFHENSKINSNSKLKNLDRNKKSFNPISRGLPKPLKLFEDAYKLEIVFDRNQSITNLKNNVDDDKPRKLQPVPLKYPNTNTKSNSNTISSNNSFLINAALESAAQIGISAMKILYDEIEPEILKKGEFLNSNHPGAFLSKFSAPNELYDNDEKAAYATITATKYFQKSYKLRATEFGRQSTDSQITFRRTSLEAFCPPRELPACLPASLRYRTHDGTCNNLRRPRWGSAQMPFNRFLPPDYEDGVDSVRQSIEGGPLASARFVSLVVHGTKDDNAPVTLMLAQWGQLIDHDLTSTAQPRSINGSIPRCCGPDDQHPSCFPIKVPFDDPWLGPLKVRCLEFLRSAPAHRRDCILAWREQTNQATSFLDASPIYSSNARTSDNARIFRDGLLAFGRRNAVNDVCLRGAISNQCIRAGDPRSGEQPGLLALHHVWVGEHNRIAIELSELNPHWSDEKIYQETRRIIGALFQHITYREFLPLVLGREVCRLFDLELQSSGYYTQYDHHTNPTIANSFAAAAFRFGHSLIQGSYMRCDRNHNFIDNNVTLHEEFSKGDLGNVESLHRLLRGMAAQRAQTRDEFITAELTNHLFQSGDFPFGLDLAAINIQRGRDHGVPRYTAWREPCGLSRIDRWEDLEDIIGPGSTKRLSHAYQSVHDIDLFVGGIAERPVIGGLVGPTFACIIAQQFSNIRKGDRFWYENSGFENSFTPAQLHSIRHVNLAQILCRATDGGTFQPHIFIPHDVPGNERVPCGIGSLAPIDLSPWLEKDPFAEKLSLDLEAQESAGFHFEPNKSQNLTIINRIDFIPHGSTGIQVMSDLARNITKIHDKLDFKPKLRPQKISQNVNNKLSSQNQKLTKEKTDHTLAVTPPPSLPGILMFNNIPITISPIPFDDDQLKTSARSQPFKINSKSDSELDKTFILLTKTKAIENEHFTRDKRSIKDDNDNKIGINLNDSLITKVQTITETDKNIDHKYRDHNCKNSSISEIENGEKDLVTEFKNTTLGSNLERGSEIIILGANNHRLIFEKQANKPIKRETDNLTMSNNTNSTNFNKIQDDITVQTLQNDKSNLMENKHVIKKRLNLTDLSEIKIWTNTDKTEIKSDHTFNSTMKNTTDKETQQNIFDETFKNEEFNKTFSQTNLTNQHSTTESITNLTDEQTLDSISTTTSKFDPELRSYTDFTDIDFDFPTSTTRHTTFTKINSTVINRPNGKVQFFDESKSTITKQIGFENKNIKYIPDNTKSTFTIQTDEGQDNDNDTESTLMFKSKIQQNRANFILANLLRRIFSDDTSNHGTLYVSSNPKTNLNLAYINHTEKLELRQHNVGTIYGSHKKPPQKIVVGPPESEEYEIEISIRPMKPSKKPNPFNYNENNSNNNHEFSNDIPNYLVSSFSHRKTTKPPSSFNENSNIYGHRTKPPTVIYVGETEETPYHPYPSRPFSQTANIHQSLVTLDTSNNVHGSYYSFPSRGTSLSSSSSSSASSSDSGSSASSSSSSSTYGSSASATASASSSGTFGSISGSASSSSSTGGSSPIFNVKIRPAPPTNTFVQSYTTTKPYEFIDPNKLLYSSNKYTPSSPYSDRYLSATNNKPSTFSNNYKPNRPTDYFDNVQLLTRHPTTSKPTFYQGPYDILRSTKIEKRNLETNESETDKIVNRNDNYDMTFNTKYDNHTETTENTNSIQFDRDGYLRPEYTTLDNKKFTDHSTKHKTNETKINDDYVLSVLTNHNMTETNLKYPSKMNQITYTDTIPRQQHFEIFAEDNFPVVNNGNNKTEERKLDLVAFAPIKILTRLERPDNWVVFNASETSPVLPEQPEIVLEMQTSKEFPKPMNRTAMGIFKRVSKKSAKFDIDDAIDSSP